MSVQEDSEKLQTALKERVLALEGECAGLRQEQQDGTRHTEQARDAERDMWMAELSKARSAVEEKAQEAQVEQQAVVERDRQIRELRADLRRAKQNLSDVASDAAT